MYLSAKFNICVSTECKKKVMEFIKHLCESCAGTVQNQKELISEHQSIQHISGIPEELRMRWAKHPSTGNRPSFPRHLVQTQTFSLVFSSHKHARQQKLHALKLQRNHRFPCKELRNGKLQRKDRKQRKKLFAYCPDFHWDRVNFLHCSCYGAFFLDLGEK